MTWVFISVFLNKVLIAYLSKNDPNLLKLASDKAIIDAGKWESGKNEITIKNFIKLLFNNKHTKWQTAHYVAISYYALMLLVLLAFIYSFFFGC